MTDPTTTDASPDVGFCARCGVTGCSPDCPDGALARLPRVEGWYSRSDGPNYFACPMPAYRMMPIGGDDSGEQVPMVEVCGYPLGLYVEDGSDFYGDLSDPSWGAPCWQLQCQGGHVLLMADGVDDVPSRELAYDPAVALSVLLDLSQQGQRLLYATPGRNVDGQLYCAEHEAYAASANCPGRTTPEGVVHDG